MDKRAGQRAAVVLSCLLVAVTGLWTGTAQAAPTCGGERATIVAGPHQTTIVGTNNEDVIVGNDLPNLIRGLAAADTICAGGGRDVVLGGGDADVIYGGDRRDTLRGGGAADTLWGEAGADELHGGGGWFDFLIGGPGDDALDGGTGGYNTVDYRTAPGPITVDLTKGTATGDGSDAIENVSNVWGSSYDDVLTGNDAPEGNMMDGGPGNDTIDGGGGDGDTIMTCDATGPVTIDLVTQTSSGEGNDTFTNMRNAYGGPYGDTLIGNDQGQAIFASCFFFQYEHPVPAEDSADVIHAGGGDDFFAGFGGTNLYDGGPGTDFGAWGEAQGPVTIDLAAGTAVTNNLDGAPSTDTITNVENVYGSYGYDDVLRGDAGPNWMFGLGGDDQLSGGAGDDWLGGEHQYYTLDDRQVDSLDGQAGFDHCTGGEQVANCESTKPISARVRLTSMERLSLQPDRVAAMSLRIPAYRPASTAASAPRTASAARVRPRVTIEEFSYDPKTIAVPRGTRITWTSATTVEHDVTLANGSWQSPLLEQGDTASHEFRKRGVYKYYCAIHPFMHGKVIVG